MAYGAAVVVPAVGLLFGVAAFIQWTGIWGCVALFLGIPLLTACYCIGTDRLSGRF
jgi:hypothetical protein